MAYRRKQGTPRATTFVDTATATASEVETAGGGDGGGDSSSLGEQAILASPAHRHSSSLSSAYGVSGSSSSSAAPRDPNRLRRSVTCTTRKDAMTYEYTSMKSLNESKYGFWGVLARKAKSIIDDEKASRQFEEHDRSRMRIPDAQMGGQFNPSSRTPDNLHKTENPTLNKSLESITSSLHQIGGTIKKSFEEGLTMVESRTADIIQETKKLQTRRKVGASISLNEATDLSPPKARPRIQNDHEMQLKASRDVANAMAAKSKLLLRELKTVKADLAFAKERCTQLEEENRLLREGRQKGQDNHEDEDLIRLQLETLLEEKGRLAHENSVYARENRFLREIVEYHQLTMQDVIYVDEGIEEFSEVSPIQIPEDSSSLPDPLAPIIKNDALEDHKEAPSTPTPKHAKADTVSEMKLACPPPSSNLQHLSPPA